MSRRRIAAALAAVLATTLLSACGESSERDASQQPQGATVRIRLGTQEFPEGRILGVDPALDGMTAGGEGGLRPG